MLRKAGYSPFLILSPSVNFISSIFLTPHQFLTLFLPLAGSDFLFPPPPCGTCQSWAQRGGEWVGATGAGRTQPYSRASLAGTRAASSAWEPPLGFLLWLSQAGFYPLIHKNKRVCREERESHYNPKGCCVNLPIAVFFSVALSSTPPCGIMWHLCPASPFFFPFYFFQSRRKPGVFPSCFLKVLSSKLHHSTLWD